MWYYEQNGQAMGPVNTTVLSTLVSSGVIQPQTQVCREGETEWHQAHETELASLFSKTALSWANNPTPVAPPLPGQSSTERSAAYSHTYGRHDISSLTTALKILLGVGVLFSFVGIMSAWSQYDLFSDLASGVYATEEEAFQANGVASVLALFLGLFQNLLGLGTIVVFAIWIYKACANAHQLSERPMKYTPGWAVGWYFIPIACLYKPYEAMKEIFQVSTTSRFGRSKSTAIVNLWWTLWIVSTALGTFTVMRTLGNTGYEAMKTASLLTMANGALGICLTLVALVMVGQIFDGQNGLSRSTTTMQPQPVA